jgi:hypothetical protein
LRQPAIAQLSRNPERFQIHHHEQIVTIFVTMSTGN